MDGNYPSFVLVGFPDPHRIRFFGQSFFKENIVIKKELICRFIPILTRLPFHGRGLYKNFADYAFLKRGEDKNIFITTAKIIQHYSRFIIVQCHHKRFFTKVLRQKFIK